MALFDSPMQLNRDWNSPCDNLIITRVKPDGFTSFFQPYDKYHLSTHDQIRFSAKFGLGNPYSNRPDRQYNEMGNMHSEVAQVQKLFNAGVDAKFDDDNEPSDIFNEEAESRQQLEQMNKEDVVKNVETTLKLYELQLRSFRKNGIGLSDAQIQQMLNDKKKLLYDQLASQFDTGLADDDSNKLSAMVASAKGGGATVAIASAPRFLSASSATPATTGGSISAEEFRRIRNTLLDSGIQPTPANIQRYYETTYDEKKNE